MEEVLPKERGKVAQCLLLLVAVGSFSVIAYLTAYDSDKLALLPRTPGNGSNTSYLVNYSLGLFATFLFAEVFRRCCLLCEEYNHLETRYHKNWASLLMATFIPSVWASGIIVLFLCTTFITYQTSTEVFLDVLFRLKQFSLLFIFVVYPVFSISEVRRNSVEVDAVLEKNSRYIGTGLAWSYYTGYLRQVLPSVQGNKPFHERIIQFEDENKVSISIKKLIILLPESCLVPGNFEKDDENITFAGTLPEITWHRAGSISRPYKMPVYKVKGRKNLSDLYLLVEAPANILGLWDMSNDYKYLTDMSKEEKVTQLKAFWRELNKILEADEECAQTYEFIYYKDINKDGTTVRLSDVLHSKVCDLKAAESKDSCHY